MSKSPPKTTEMQRMLRRAPGKSGTVSIPGATARQIADLLQEGDSMIEEMVQRRAILMQIFSELLQRDCSTVADSEAQREAVRSSCARVKALLALEASAKGRICCGEVMHYYTNTALKCEKCCTILVTG